MIEKLEFVACLAALISIISGIIIILSCTVEETDLFENRLLKIITGILIISTIIYIIV